MENPHAGETSLRTFNTAKKYAEEILFPKMDLYQRFQRQADFGHEDLSLASQLSEEIRDIERYNGLKGMSDTVLNLLVSISSTVRLKGNKDEVDKLNELLEILKNMRTLFDIKRDNFFKSGLKQSGVVDVLDRNYFNKIKDLLNLCYINTEILMTKNKLIFADSNDDYLSDKELLEQIKSEYTGD